MLLESHETPRILFGAELGKLTVAKLNQMHAWNLSEALGVGRYEVSQGYTSREVIAAVHPHQTLARSNRFGCGLKMV